MTAAAQTWSFPTKGRILLKNSVQMTTRSSLDFLRELLAREAGQVDA
jgi:hypothetical protein